jgi:hypothetical protein
MFSLLSGIGIAYLDKIAEKNSEKKIMIKDDEKFALKAIQMFDFAFSCQTSLHERYMTCKVQAKKLGRFQILVDRHELAEVLEN